MGARKDMQTLGPFALDEDSTMICSAVHVIPYLTHQQLQMILGAVPDGACPDARHGQHGEETIILNDRVDVLVGSGHLAHV